jgi:hypothetical protein
MRTDSIVANLRALVRANAIIAEIQARRVLTRSGITGVAALIGVFGLVMLGIAGFFALEPIWGRVWAAVAVGLASLVIALLLVLIAGRIKPARDIELARQVHGTAMEGLVSDFRAIESEMTELRNWFRNPIESIIPSVVVPLAGIVLNTLKRRTERAKGEEE